MIATIFGWCSANQHDACYQIAPGQSEPLICSCECHDRPAHNTAVGDPSTVAVESGAVSGPATRQTSGALADAMKERRQ